MAGWRGATTFASSKGNMCRPWEVPVVAIQNVAIDFRNVAAPSIPVMPPPAVPPAAASAASPVRQGAEISEAAQCQVEACGENAGDSPEESSINFEGNTHWEEAEDGGRGKGVVFHF